MSNPLFKKKPMDWLLQRSQSHRRAHPETHARPRVAHRARRRRRNRRRNFRAHRPGRHTTPAPALTLSFIVSGLGCVLRGFLLRGIRRDDSARRQRLHLRLRRARRTNRLDHRLGPDSGICHGRQHRLLRLVESFHRISQNFRPEDAALARLRPLDRPGHRRKRHRAPEVHASDPSLVVGTSRLFVYRVAQILTAQPLRSAAPSARPRRRAANLSVSTLASICLPSSSRSSSPPSWWSASRKAPTSMPPSSSSKSPSCSSSSCSACAT